MCSVARDAARGAVGSRSVVEQAVVMGAEDMSYVLARVPGCYMTLGSRNKKKGLVHPHHSPRFDFDEEALAIGVEVWLQLAARGIG
jgi:amidohydrolase